MLYKSVATRGLARKHEARRVGRFAPLTAASILALTCAVTLAPAHAEGLPDRRGSIKDVAVVPACGNFHGFYQGVHLGAGFQDWSWNDRDAWAKGVGEEFPGSVSSTDNSVIGGIQAGFNWQKGCTVFGLEADWSWADLGNTKVHTADDNDNDDDELTVSSKIQGFGTLRTRAGVVVDDLLLYVTGGLAFADIERRATLNDDDDRETFKSGDTRLGWTAGFGAEWALTERISIKSEALWFRFEEDGTTRISEQFKDDEGKRFDNQDSVWVGRIGLNFKFGYDAPLHPRWLP